MRTKILVVDDQRGMADAISVALQRDGHECEVFTSGQEALDFFREHGGDLVVTDLRMPNLDGLELIRRLKAIRQSLPVILVTAFGDISSAVAAIRAGAFDYVTKPFDNEELRRLVRRAIDLQRLQDENQLLREELGKRVYREMVVESPAMKQVLELVDRAAPTDATVLIQGASGTGKEMIARRLHFRSDRVGRPFVAIHCKALAATVLESELFGHAKGAFTGAASARPGCFERADGGTLFLDEIGEVDLEFQVKILRVLQEGEVLRVGGDRPKRVDVRVIAATNRDLNAELQAGRFREDLFFRLNVIPVHLPSLGQRREDILPLANHFLARHSGRCQGLSLAAEKRLLEYAWPGNVRELENTIERACILATGEKIEAADLLLENLQTDAWPEVDQSLQAFLDQATRQKIQAVLASCQGRKGETAERLGVDRTTLYRLMKRLGLDSSG